MKPCLRKLATCATDEFKNVFDAVFGKLQRISPKVKDFTSQSKKTIQNTEHKFVRANQQKNQKNYAASIGLDTKFPRRHAQFFQCEKGSALDGYMGTSREYRLVENFKYAEDFHSLSAS